MLSIPLVAALAFLLALDGLLFDTAATAYLPDLLGRDPAPLERAHARLRGAQTAAAPSGAFLGGWLATTYDLRTPLYAAAGLLLAMTAVTATMTSNRRVEAALRSARPQADPAGQDPAKEIAVHTTSR
ncbi:hypothetical protein [Microbispora siamensis]|uniref:MFS transporter n=1 Tax=Microbispora siamensis TaxID=564413 RepID=A0ABQ4GTD1_9ACTN|nr:hypothetical protein [Microbispora siamensis]GIH64701.1 hypothetical protein Msi02_55180 [Microbispora siamensis]